MRYNKIMKNILKKVLPLLVVLFMLLAPVVSLNAQIIFDDAEGTPPTGKLHNPIPADSLEEFIATILKGVIKVGIPLVVIMIIYSGFLFVTALGNTEKLSKAKDALLWSVVGAAVLLGSWAIAELIVDTVTTIQEDTGMAPQYLVYESSQVVL